MDLRNMTADSLDALRLDIINEQERRANLEGIPDQIAAMAKLFRDGGGDEAALQDALSPEQVAALDA